jgi:hypothetical protein
VNHKDTIRALREAIGSARFHFSDEAALQTGLEMLLNGMGLLFEREYELKPFGRIDFFLFESAIGLEVKTKGSPSAVLKQLHGYAQHPKISAMLLVTAKIRLERVPTSINGKDLFAISLWANGL